MTSNKRKSNADLRRMNGIRFVFGYLCKELKSDFPFWIHSKLSKNNCEQTKKRMIGHKLFQWLEEMNKESFSFRLID